MDRLADFAFHDNLIPHIVENYNQYTRLKDGALYGQIAEIEAHLKETQADINRVVGLLVKTSSDALLGHLSDLENKKAALQARQKELVENTTTPKADEKQIRAAFKQAQRFLRSGQLSTTKRLVERYVNQVVVYPDRVYVEFNLGLDIDLPVKGQMPYEKGTKIPQNPADQSNDSTVFPTSSTKDLCALSGGEHGGIIMNCKKRGSAAYHLPAYNFVLKNEL